ncbi:MAG: signal recognition particle protein [Actinomycetota bacterium]
MFDALSDRLESIFQKIRSRGRLTDADVEEFLREIRTALLEADVSTTVIKPFLERIRERAVGEEVSKALTPAQQVTKIVYEELVEVLGEHAPLKLGSRTPSVLMLVGLQGSGKTTASAKLAKHLSSKGKRPLLIACDLQRPAAVAQLQQLGERIDVPVYSDLTATPVQVAAQGIAEAKRLGRDIVIVDTAGRLAIDEELMAEAAAIRDQVQPAETLLVVDAMTGQDAVAVASSFAEKVDYSGIILSKLDGDARGGAALSIRVVSGKPVKFASVGEGIEDLEPFHPDRLAQRILGMGDVLTLIERAEAQYEAEEQAELEEKLRKAEFGLDDFLDQMRKIKRMGSLTSLLGMLPGMRGSMKDIDIDDAELDRIAAIIHSMTPDERRVPKVIDGSRRTRIANGCGRSVMEVNALLKRFEEAKKLMKAMSGGGGLPSMPYDMGPKASGPHRPKPKRAKKSKQHGKNKKKKRK